MWNYFAVYFQEWEVDVWFLLLHGSPVLLGFEQKVFSLSGEMVAQGGGLKIYCQSELAVPWETRRLLSLRPDLYKECQWFGRRVLSSMREAVWTAPTEPVLPHREARASPLPAKFAASAEKPPTLVEPEELKEEPPAKEELPPKEVPPAPEPPAAPKQKDWGETLENIAVAVNCCTVMSADDTVLLRGSQSVVRVVKPSEGFPFGRVFAGDGGSKTSSDVHLAQRVLGKLKRNFEETRSQ